MSKADKLLNDKNYQQRDALKDLLDNYHQHGIRPCLVYNDPSGLEDALQRSVEDDSHDFLKQFDAMSRHIAALDESEAELWKRYTDSLALKDIREDLVEKRTFRHLKDEMYQGYRCDVECLPQLFHARASRLVASPCCAVMDSQVCDAVAVYLARLERVSLTCLPTCHPAPEAPVP